jgi:large subunit ribosomal protein L1
LVIENLYDRDFQWRNYTTTKFSCRSPRPAGTAFGGGRQEEQMKKAGKNITKARQAVEARPYLLKDAVPLLQKVKYTKFDETVEITMRLGVDPKHADQMVRGTVVLPHGLGKSKKVLVIATGDKVKEAEAAGADYVGGEEMVEKINKENWTDFDALIATPDVMKSVGRLGKVLGPKGLMPNPKTGTVTFDVAKAVKEVKAGKVEFRTDKTALVHVPVGKISFTPDKLVENATVVISSVIKAKPTVAKGKYIKGCYLSSTMGPGISIDTAQVEAAAKA